jgi:hypothetical protein
VTKPRDKKDSEPGGKRKRPKLKKETLRDLAAREEDAERMKGGWNADCSEVRSGCSL